MISSVRKGDSAELLLTHRLVESGLQVLKPVSADLPFDLGVYENGFFRIQVKRARLYRDTGLYHFDLVKVIGRQLDGTYRKYRYDKSMADFLAAIVVEVPALYVFPIEALGSIKDRAFLDPNGVRVSKRKMSVNSEEYRDRIELNGRVIRLATEPGWKPGEP